MLKPNPHLKLQACLTMYVLPFSLHQALEGYNKLRNHCLVAELHFLTFEHKKVYKVNTFIYIYIYIYNIYKTYIHIIYIYIYIQIYIDIDRQIDRQIDRYIYRYTYIYIEIDKYIHTYTYIYIYRQIDRQQIYLFIHLSKCV